MSIEEKLEDETSKVLKSQTILEGIHDVIHNIQREENPFMILDLRDVIYKLEYWNKKLPRVKPHLAVKTNDVKAVRQTLALLGTGFDCASKAEIDMVLDMGVSPSRIVYTHPCKGAYHLRHAATHNVNLTVFDNEGELLKIKEIMPNANLLLRIASDDASSKLSFSSKFGVFPEDVVPLLQKAKSLGLNVIGTTFNVGTDVSDIKGYVTGIEECRKAFDAAKKLGFTPYLLDIGGGFPGRLGPVLDRIFDSVNESLETHFPEKDITIIGEPGRYFSESAFMTVTQIVSKRKMKDEVVPNEPMYMYYINDSYHGSFGATLFYPVTPTALKEYGKSPSERDRGYRCSVMGNTCDCLDFVIPDTTLPEMEVGEWLVWEYMGAYSAPLTRTFNGFPKPIVYILLPEKSMNLLKENMKRGH